MRSRLATGQQHARPRTVAAIQPVGWAGARVETASNLPRIVRTAREDDLGPARGIGLALIAGACIWGGVAWGAASLVAGFF